MLTSLYKSEINRKKKAVHVTDLQGFEKLLTLQNKKGVLISAARTFNQTFLEDGAWRNGIACTLEGNILMDSNDDLWSIPDTSGNRWISISNAVDNANLSQNKFKKMYDEIEELKGKIGFEILNEMTKKRSAAFLNALLKNAKSKKEQKFVYDSFERLSEVESYQEFKIFMREKMHDSPQFLNFTFIRPIRQELLRWFPPARRLHYMNRYQEGIFPILQKYKKQLQPVIFPKLKVKKNSGLGQDYGESLIGNFKVVEIAITNEEELKKFMRKKLYTKMKSQRIKMRILEDAAEGYLHSSNANAKALKEAGNKANIEVIKHTKIMTEYRKLIN